MAAAAKAGHEQSVKLHLRPDLGHGSALVDLADR
jgi:hypothetical protein